jgi:hypothetical protein
MNFVEGTLNKQYILTERQSAASTHEKNEPILHIRISNLKSQLNPYNLHSSSLRAIVALLGCAW